MKSLGIFVKNILLAEVGTVKVQITLKINGRWYISSQANCSILLSFLQLAKCELWTQHSLQTRSPVLHNSISAYIKFGSLVFPTKFFVELQRKAKFTLVVRIRPSFRKTTINRRVCFWNMTRAKLRNIQVQFKKSSKLYRLFAINQIRNYICDYNDNTNRRNATQHQSLDWKTIIQNGLRMYQMMWLPQLLFGLYVFLSQVPAISNGRVVALHVEPIKAVQ